MFLLELNLDAQLLQMPDGFQQVYCVPGKARYGLRENDVDVARLALRQHPLEFRPVDLGARDAVVRKHARVHPAWVPLYKRTVVADLRGKRMV